MSLRSCPAAAWGGTGTGADASQILPDREFGGPLLYYDLCPVCLDAFLEGWPHLYTDLRLRELGARPRHRRLHA